MITDLDTVKVQGKKNRYDFLHRKQDGVDWYELNVTGLKGGVYVVIRDTDEAGGSNPPKWWWGIYYEGPFMPATYSSEGWSAVECMSAIAELLDEHGVKTWV